MKTSIVVLAAALIAAPAAAGKQEEKEAKALAKEGDKLAKAGDHAGAIDKYRAALAKSDLAETQLKLAGELEAAGRVAEATQAYDAYVKHPKADQKKKPDAEKKLAAVMARVGRLRVVVEEPFAKVTVDGKALGDSPIRMTLRADPGKHTVVAERAGLPPASKEADLPPGGDVTVELTVAPPPSALPPPPVPEPSPPPQPAAAGLLEMDLGGEPAVAKEAEPAPAGEDLSHAWQVGGFARADIDPIGADNAKGVVPAIGASFGITDWVELSAAGLLGRTKGWEPRVACLVLHGEWKPLVYAGAPVLYSDGARAAINGGAGVQWDPSRNFGVFLTLGVAHFLTALPDNVDKTIFLPSVGAQARY